MIKVLELPEASDLSELSRELWVRKIGHQIRLRSPVQEIWLADPEHYPQLLQLVQDWQKGELAYTVDTDASSFSLKPALTKLVEMPVTLGFLIVSVLVSLLIAFESEPLVLSALTIVPFQQVAQGLAYQPLPDTLLDGELWRLITPVFLHFGALHIIFNGLWIWELGHLIETRQSSRSLLFLILLSGVLANLAQYMVGDILFGGLSGVVYALLGYCWFWDRFSGQPLFQIRRPVFIILLVWLVFCLVGGAGMLGFGNIANAAHIGGLVSGSLWAWLRCRSA